MGSSNEEQPFHVEWKDDGFVASMDDPHPLLELNLRHAVVALLWLPVIPALAWVIGYENYLLLYAAAVLSLLPPGVLLSRLSRHPQRAVLECDPAHIAIKRTLRRGHTLVTRQITEVIPGKAGLHIITDNQRVWVPCPDAHLQELVTFLEEALRRYTSFEGDMERPEVIEASRQARAVLARKTNTELG